MKQEESGIDQMREIAKRRKKLLVIIPIVVTILSGVIAYILPKQYESSTTILAQKSKTLNPLISYRMAVQLANNNQLSSFNQIIYSRSSINMLIDSLNLAKPGITAEERDELIKKVKKNITTKLDQSNIFTIAYANQDPRNAKRGVDLLSNHFIESNQQLDDKQNSETVKFFQNEVNRLKKIVDKKKAERLSTVKKRVSTVPDEDPALQSQLEGVNTNIGKVSSNLTHLQQQYDLLKSLNSAIQSGRGDVPILMKLDLDNLPYGTNLQPLLQKYISLKQNYTDKYPAVKQLKQQIADLASQIPSALKTKINTLTQQQNKLESQRSTIVSQIEKNSLAKGEDQSQADDYGVYQGLYNKMKVKLEQARVNYQLGLSGKQQFIVIDPAIIPSKPSKPKRKLIIVGGFMMGLLLGIITAAAAEMLDTTIRSPKDLELYGKPIIAFIPEGSH